jgi:hypothetical protein
MRCSICYFIDPEGYFNTSKKNVYGIQRNISDFALIDLGEFCNLLHEFVK